MLSSIEKKGEGSKEEVEEEGNREGEGKDGMGWRGRMCKMEEEVRSYSSCSIAGRTSGWRLAANTFQGKFNNSLNLVMEGQMEG